MTKDELLKENERLRKKLSPLEDPAFTERLALKLASVSLRGQVREIRGQDHVVVVPKDLFRALFNAEPDQKDLTNMARSLQAMCWERYAHNGMRMFIMPLTEYLEAQQ